MNLKSLKHGLLHGLVIMNFAGHPFVEMKEEKVKPTLVQNLSLKSDTYVRTNPHEYLVLKINDLYQVTVLPDSILTVDGTRHEDEFNILSISIRRGRVHILEMQDPKAFMLQELEKKSKSKIKVVNVKKQKNSKVQIVQITSLDPSSADKTAALVASGDTTPADDFAPLSIESDFFSFMTEKNQKLSLFIDVDLKAAALNVCNYGPDFKLELFNHEESQMLKKNEGVKFQGVLNKAGHVDYDLLLEKRRVPKGKWEPKKTCSVDQVKQIQDEIVKFQWQDHQKKEKSRIQALADKKRDDSFYLCHEPYGKLDQCHFILRQNKCLRERCNAEGKWTNQTEIGIAKNLCTAAGEVKDCGY